MMPSHGEYHVPYRVLPGVSSPALSVVMNDEPGYICWQVT